MTAQSFLFVVEAQLSAILATPTPKQPPQHTPGDVWSAGLALTSFGATDVPSLLLQLQPSFEELQHTAAHIQQLLMAGHRLEALRQACTALCPHASCECVCPVLIR